MKSKLIWATIALILGMGLAWTVDRSLSRAAVGAQDTFAMAITDQTPTEPLSNPDPAGFEPRYISGFGHDDTFTVFFEDRDAAGRIHFNQTSSGPLGFAAVSTATNIIDTHLVVKDWAVTVTDTTHAYRAWGSVGNNPDHHFYVSDDMINWTLVSTFTIANSPAFTTAKGYVYYGFHDVILLNGTYYAFAESNQSQTMIVSSTTGTDDWIAFDSIGGPAAIDGPLQLPVGVTGGWTPSGSFVDMGHDRGYAKVHVDPRDAAFYLAINTAARANLPAADLEAAFIDPANWTWHDGSTGPAATPILIATGEHDLRECWVVPSSDPDAAWTIVYDADFGAADGDKALGYASATPPPCRCPPDGYEPDNIPAMADGLSVGITQTRNFCDDNADWITFTAQAGNTYTITAASQEQRADPLLALYAPLSSSSARPIAADFDSRIVWRAPADGVYYLLVTNGEAKSSCDTEYEIWLQEKKRFRLYLPILLRGYSE